MDGPGSDPDRPGPVRRHAVVSGRVQGVFFRASCAEEARRLGVTGFVTNLHDGRVELEVEGDRAAVDALLEWCRHGPTTARVDRVEVDDLAPQGSVRFAIR